jgi:hypothetical protein
MLKRCKTYRVVLRFHCVIALGAVLAIFAEVPLREFDKVRYRE